MKYGILAVTVLIGLAISVVVAAILLAGIALFIWVRNQRILEDLNSFLASKALDGLATIDEQTSGNGV